MILEQTTYLGPARVLASAGGRVRIALPEQEAWALLALAYPYHPEPGDIVLAAGQDENYWVIGVVRGTGMTSFVAPGSISFSAPSGSIELSAGHGVRIKAPDVEVKAGRLRLAARSAVEKFGDAWRWVRDTLQVRAGRTRTVVEGDATLRADRIIERATGTVSIDGEKINLG